MTYPWVLGVFTLLSTTIKALFHIMSLNCIPWNKVECSVQGYILINQFDVSYKSWNNVHCFADPTMPSNVNIDIPG